jgi:hypothetical protein
MAAQRPAAKEGGRREEENRSGISAGDAGRLCNAKLANRLGQGPDHGYANFDAKPITEFRRQAPFAPSFQADL